MKNPAVAFLGVLIFFGVPARAQQELPRVEFFGGYSNFHVNLPDNIIKGGGSEGEAVERVGEFILGNILGWGAEVTVNLNRTFGVTGDFSGHYKSLNDITVEGTDVSADASIHTFLIGPKFTTSGDRVRAFARVLLGVARIKASGKVDFESADFNDNVFAAAVGGGLDIEVHPNIAIRAFQIDFFPIHRDSLTFNNFRWRTGIVFME